MTLYMLLDLSMPQFPHVLKGQGSLKLPASCLFSPPPLTEPAELKFSKVCLFLHL